MKVITKNTAQEFEKSIPWIEKYRPKSINDIISQDEIVALLRSSIENSDLPNLLFYGPPGTGKTSTIIAASKDLFGAKHYRDRVLELNASDERGIKIVREKVKTFAQIVAPPLKLKEDGVHGAPFKIIILDEADSMTSFAQAALRRIMEKECKTTRFCIICNYISKIIDPISSRCAKFRFKPIETEILRGRLLNICNEEKVIVKEEILNFIIKACNGDLRKAITYLQTSIKMKKPDTELSLEDAYETTGVIRDNVIQNFYNILTDPKGNLIKFTEDFMSMGYSLNQLISQLTHFIITHTSSDEAVDSQNIKTNCMILEKCAEIEYKINDGADEELQLLDLLAFAYQARKFK